MRFDGLRVRLFVGSACFTRFCTRFSVSKTASGPCRAGPCWSVRWVIPTRVQVVAFSGLLPRNAVRRLADTVRWTVVRHRLFYSFHRSTSAPETLSLVPTVHRGPFDSATGVISKGEVVCSSADISWFTAVRTGGMGVVGSLRSTVYFLWLGKCL
jgi:hypothetical protein